MKSFIPVLPDSHFPIQNLPYGIFQPKNDKKLRAGTAIGEFVLDLSVLDSKGFFGSTQAGGKNIFSQDYLNSFMSLGNDAQREVRKVVQSVLAEDNEKLRDDENLRKQVFYRADEVKMCMPVNIGDYTDFYSFRKHAENVGTMFRGKDNALMPNWLHLPVAYHGRVSSVILSGTDISRPSGQVKDEKESMPSFGPSKMLDFELEMGLLIGKGNDLGNRIQTGGAMEHIFGMVLVNDWSARDIQKWEYVPLGPFLGKNFATSVSPWIVTMDALEPFRVPNPVQDPEPLPYLRSKDDCSYDIQLEIFFKTKKLSKPEKISVSNFQYMYWNICQQIAHHTVNGCNLRTGDLIASGTVSGPGDSSYGSMLELSWNGTKPLKLSSGEERSFIEDDDEVIMTGYCQGEGYRVGFGEVRGRVAGK